MTARAELVNALARRYRSGSRTAKSRILDPNGGINHDRGADGSTVKPFRPGMRLRTLRNRVTSRRSWATSGELVYDPERSIFVWQPSNGSGAFLREATRLLILIDARQIRTKHAYLPVLDKNS